MIGVDQCGLTETVEVLLNSFPADIQQRLVNVSDNHVYVFVL